MRAISAVSAEIAEWPECEIPVFGNASQDGIIAIVEHSAKPDACVRVMAVEENRLYAVNVGRGMTAAAGDRISYLMMAGGIHSFSRHRCRTRCGCMGLFLDTEKCASTEPCAPAYCTQLLLCRLIIGLDLRNINAGVRRLARFRRSGGHQAPLQDGISRALLNRDKPGLGSPKSLSVMSCALRVAVATFLAGHHSLCRRGSSTSVS